MLGLGLNNEELVKLEILTRDKKKSVGAYLGCWFIGVQYIYTGEIGKFIGYWLTLGGLGFWALYCLFTASSKINKINDQVMTDTATLIKQEKMSMYSGR